MLEIKDQIKNMGFKTRDNLKKEYIEACKDEKFTNLVKKLKIDDITLMKNTSQLKVCSNNYDNCLNCKNILECKQEIKGYCYLPKVVDGKLNFNYQPCKYRKKLDNSTKYLKNTFVLDEPIEIKEASIDKIYMKDKNRFEAIEAIHKFLVEYKKDKNQKGLFLYGNFGCGKTYMISALFNELAKDGVKSAIVFWPEFLRNLKSSFSTDFNEKYEYIKKVPLLLIDDIGAENTTSWGRDEIFCPLIQYRMQEKLPTFFTSNLDMESLEQHFSVSKDGVDIIKSRRIIERIKQLTKEIQIVSKNLRN